MIYVLLILVFFWTTHELARRHRTRAYASPERLRDIWRWRLSPLDRRRLMATESVSKWWTAAHGVAALSEEVQPPAVEFGSGLNHALAWADSKAMRIRVSEPWLRRLGWADVHETMGHEVAHLITDSTTPEGRPHGPKWKKTMKVLGLPPTVTYDASVPASASGVNQGPTPNPVRVRIGSVTRAKPLSTPKPARPHAGGRTHRPRQT